MKGNGHGAGTFMDPNALHLPLTRLFERVSVHGRRRLTGRLGASRVVLIETDEVSDGDKVWRMYLTEGPYQPENAAAPAREVERNTR